ncbi:hypothetical protein G3N95_37060 [Paraburkholderia sp. Tr-20389]|uniref:DUF6387 family protein n=1 Tax=Paraburkholderia sp. Tr-20389 TaxID=2703903 RepID=UPI001981E010|nr:DUF6387 family protein [Paraburkholderia sp. Tr-20389]MBN3758570.1 hypothetical protein [Paraburkholderia sp. Tr-20389]
MKNRRPRLPTFFDITKYEGAERLTLEDWALNLNERNSDLRAANLLVDGTVLRADSETLKALHIVLFRRCLRRIQAPLLLAASDDTFDIYPGVEQPVAELTVRDVAGISHLTREAAEAEGIPHEVVARLFSSDERFEGPEDEQLHRLADQPCRILIESIHGFSSDMGVAHIIVDLTVPLDDLLKHIASFVKEFQSRVGMKKPRRGFDRNHFIRWHEMKVLAYIDLQIISVLRRTKFTDNEIATALFPNEIELSSPAERVRRTVRPMANSLMTVQTSRVLAGQVRAKKQKKKTRHEFGDG